MSNIEFDETTTAKLLKGITIPPQPQVLLLVMAEQRKSDPDLPKIAREVSKDVGLSAAMLRAVNSAAFGLSKKATSIAHAVMLLGLHNSINLITGLSLRIAISGKSKINLNHFWAAAMDTALICAALARRFKIMDADQAHMMGLFHNCGIPLMMQRFTDYAKKLMNLDPDAGELIVNLEEQHFNTNHAIVGYLVSRSWGLPESIRLAILNHHNENLLKEAQNNSELLVSQVAMLTLAEHLCHVFHHGSDDLVWLRIGKEVRRLLYLNDDDLQDLAEDAADILSTL